MTHDEFKKGKPFTYSPLGLKSAARYVVLEAHKSLVLATNEENVNELFQFTADQFVHCTKDPS